MLHFVLLLILVYNCMQGLKRGLVLQLSSIVKTILSIFIAYQLFGDLASILEKNIPLNESNVPVDLVYRAAAFIILWLGSRFALSFLFGFINQVFQLPILSFFNRIGGLGFGILQSIIIFVVVVNLLYILPWEPGQKAVKTSNVAQIILDTLPSIKTSNTL